jgi:hypothetical protein
MKSLFVNRPNHRPRATPPLREAQRRVLRYLIATTGRVGLVGSIAAASTVMAPGLASASSLDSQVVPGTQTQVSCLTSQLCVLVGTNKGAGDVVDVTGGKPGKPAMVKGSHDLYAVDCPAPAGCIALGEASSPTGPLLVEINALGRVTGTERLKLPAGASLTSLSCVSLYACALWGIDATNTKVLEFAQWDGSSLRFEQVAGPAGSTKATVTGISCFAVTCVAVGSAHRGKDDESFVVSTTGRKIYRFWTVNATSLSGVSCTSATLCYTSGYNPAGGIVITLRNGAPTTTSISPSDNLYGIACGPSSCLAVGQEPAPRVARPTATRYGTLVDVEFGAVTSTQVVPVSGGYTSVAAPLVGAGFAVLGKAQRSGYEVTTLA